MSIPKPVALALVAAAALGMSPAPVAVNAPLVGYHYQAPAQQQRAPATQTVTVSARDEIERVNDLSLPIFRSRRVWDGKNRSSGDRAHKRMKNRRSSGRK